jgi:hypothetical protein
MAFEIYLHFAIYCHEYYIVINVLFNQLILIKKCKFNFFLGELN